MASYAIIYKRFIYTIETNDQGLVVGSSIVNIDGPIFLYMSIRSVVEWVVSHDAKIRKLNKMYKAGTLKVNSKDTARGMLC